MWRRSDSVEQLVNVVSGSHLRRVGDLEDVLELVSDEHDEVRVGHPSAIDDDPNVASPADGHNHMGKAGAEGPECTDARLDVGDDVSPVQLRPLLKCSAMAV
jgi:hypothetical protein